MVSVAALETATNTVIGSVLGIFLSITNGTTLTLDLGVILNVIAAQEPKDIIVNTVIGGTTSFLLIKALQFTWSVLQLGYEKLYKTIKRLFNGRHR